MSEHTLVGLIGIVVMITLFFSRMPVAYVMGVVGFLGYAFLTDMNAGLKLLSRDLYSVF